MDIRNVTILGGSGFVGWHLARMLTLRGINCVVPTRNRERAKRELLVLPTLSAIEADIHRDADLDRVVAGADAVVNLVGILHESRRKSFHRIHAELPVRIIEACQRTGVQRYVHMSALGAHAAGPSRYLRSKGEGEAHVMAAGHAGLAVTVIRPSVIFGRGDSFLTMFGRMLRVAPLIPLGSPNARFQPVWVEDVARAIADALAERDTFGCAYELCGPSVYTLRELVRLTAATIGCRRPIVGLGKTASWLQALAMELSPVKILTRDNVRSMSVDNVCGCGWPAVFGFKPAALEAVLPNYLGSEKNQAYDDYRSRAGR